MPQLRVNTSSVMEQLTYWFGANGLCLNLTKTALLHFQIEQMFRAREKNNSVMQPINGTDTSNSNKFLGVIIQHNMKWENHINDLYGKLSKSIFAIRCIRKVADTKTVMLVYHGYFLSVAKYGIEFWGCSPHMELIFKLQKRVVRVIAGVRGRASCRQLFKERGLLTLPAIYILEVAVMVKTNCSKFSTKNISINTALDIETIFNTLSID
jgi:hypothetical protein